MYSKEAVDIGGSELFQGTPVLRLYDSMRYFDIRKRFSVALLQMNTNILFLYVCYTLARLFFWKQVFYMEFIVLQLKT